MYPFDEGVEAYENDQGYADNPYTLNTPAWLQWFDGYRHAEINGTEGTVPPERRER